MSGVIFCKTRWQDEGYQPYEDYFRLVELSGYPIIYVDELDPNSDCTYIVTPLNGEWQAGWHRPRARIIHYELEWRTDWRADADAPPGVAEVWTIDAHYAQQIGAKYVPIGSHPDLAGYWDVNALDNDREVWRQPSCGGPRLWDVALLAYMVPRRERIAQELLQRGVTIFYGAWGAERHLALCRSRAILHVHQHGHIKGVACLRWALAAAYRLPVITEELWDGGIFRDRVHMLVGSYHNLANYASVWTRNGMLDGMAEALHQLLCHERTFRRNVEAAL